MFAVAEYHPVVCDAFIYFSNFKREAGVIQNQVKNAFLIFKLFVSVSKHIYQNHQIFWQHFLLTVP